jgi:predicted RND superfamily exporter protein
MPSRSTAEERSMNQIVRAIASMVVRAPWVVIGVVIVVTFGLGYFNSEQEQVTGNEGFSPDNEQLTALERSGQLFGSTDTVMQVIVESESGDVFSADAYEAATTLRDAIQESEVSDRLAEQPGRDSVITWFAPAEQAAAAQGIDLASLDDEQLKDLYRQAYASLPDEQTGFIDPLVGEGGDIAEAEGGKALLLLFLDTADLGDDFAAITELQTTVVDAVDQAELPDDISAEAFAFGLLFEEQDVAAEIARLFAFAALIILVVLAFVYSIRPRGDGTWLGAVRRTVADIAITLGAIIIAITWTNGIGVLLGPDYLDVIGYFNPITQIIPILLIGLGVDYAIHLNSRYREEVSAGEGVADGIHTALTTVGIALVLATVTTFVGFMTNLTNPLPALRDFGILASVGIVAAFLVLMTFVLASRFLLDRRAERRERLSRESLATTQSKALPALMSRTAVLAEQVPFVTLGVTLVLAGLGAYGLTQLSTEFSFTDFIGEDEPILETYETLQADFGGGFGETTTVVFDGDVATPEAHNAMVDALENLGDVDDVRSAGGTALVSMPPTILGELLAPAPTGGPPPGAGDGAQAQGGQAPDTAQGQQAPDAAQSQGDQAAQGQQAGQPTEAAEAQQEQQAQAPPDAEQVPEDAQAAQQGGQAPQAPAAPPELLQAVAAAGLGEDLRVADDADVAALYQALLDAAPDRASSVLAETDDGFAGQAQIQTSAGETGAGDLADGLDEAFAPVADAGVDFTATSDAIISDVVVTEVQNAQVQSLVITVLAAMLLLIIVFWVRMRRPFLGVLTVLPVGLVLLWTFGIMAALGIAFSPVTATISALAIGIGVPFTIHVAIRFQEDRRRFDNPEDAIRSTTRFTGGALAGSAFTTMAGFLVLRFSSLPPFQQLGTVVAIAVGCSLVAAVLVLPSLLVLWDRWHRRRGDAPTPVSDRETTTSGV